MGVGNAEPKHVIKHNGTKAAGQLHAVGEVETLVFKPVRVVINSYGECCNNYADRGLI